MADLIDRQEALKELAAYIHLIDKTMGKGTLTDDDCMEAAKSVLGEDELPAAQPDNQTNLCDSCDCSYPDCPSKYDDVIFGNGIGNDNICACNKYKPSAQPEQRWIPCSERLPKEGQDILAYRIFGEDERIIPANYSHGCWFDCHMNCSVDHIVAWMPLPDPYRGGGK